MWNEWGSHCYKGGSQDCEDRYVNIKILEYEIVQIFVNNIFPAGVAGGETAIFTFHLVIVEC